MNVVVKDNNGVKRNFLWQYDKGQTLVIEDFEYNEVPEVHFATSSSDEAIVVTSGVLSNGTLSVDIPDPLLLNAKQITVYLYANGSIKGKTIKTFDIVVMPRKRPDQYIYTDDMYVIDVKSIHDGVSNYINTNIELVEDVVINYTTVRLIDDADNETEYIVGINNGKLYIKKDE